MSKVSSKQMMKMAAIFAVLIAAIIFMSGREEKTEEYNWRKAAKNASKAAKNAAKRIRKRR